MKNWWNEYKVLWREMPGAMIVVHFAVTGGVVVAVLFARNLALGAVALIAWLLGALAIVGPCLMMDEMRKD